MTTNKIIKTLLFPICISLMMVSCADDFLTEIDPNQITVESFWKTESDFTKGLMAVYNALEGSGAMGSGAMSGHIQAELTVPVWTNSAGVELLEFNVATNNSNIQNKWSALYLGVFRANQVLDNLQDSNFDSTFKIGIEAEARFLRGMFYFWLASSFNNGSIVVHTTTPKVDADYYKPLSSKDEVYALIIADLKFAQANLPRTRNTANLGRATWGAATGILGQLYLYEKRYEDAKKEFKAIIDSDLYRLTPDISWNFDEEHEWNTESIFEVNFSAELKGGQNYSTGRASGIAPQEAGGGRTIEPSYYAIMLFKSDPPDPANPINQGQKFSQRCLASICFKGDGQIFYQRPSFEFPFMVNQEAHIKKFQNWTLPQEPTTNRSGINERVLRLADVYLMYAETVLVTLGDGGVSEAIGYVNRIRERSAVLKLDPAEYNTSGKLLTHIMRVERALELAWEGQSIRWQDLKRWGIVKQVYDELSQVKYYRHDVSNSNVELTIATQEQINNPAQGFIIRSEFEPAAQNYDPAIHDFYPIPNSETVLNPNIK